MVVSNHRRTTREGQRLADQRRRCGDAKGYGLIEATKDGIWALWAEGLSEAEIGRRLGILERG